MAPSPRLPMSVAIIARDEADRIGDCLQSLRFADEVVVVVDERSRDETLDIALAHGCRAVSRPWPGYGAQKQYAVDLAANEWVLILDADERVPGATADCLTALFAGPRTDAAYSLSRKNYFHGRWIRHCGWWPDRVVRLVNKNRGRFSPHRVHERWVADGPTTHLDAAIEHCSFRDYAGLIEKMQHYSTLSAMQMNAEGIHVAWWTPPLHGLWMFVRTYLLELGIMEGFDGLVISLLNAGGSFLKYAKARELRHHATVADRLPPAPLADPRDQPDR